MADKPRYAPISDIHDAAEAGDLDRLRAILDREPEKVNEQSVVNYPLHSAIGQSHFEAARFLIGRGADVNAKGLNGETALHLTARYDTPKHEIAKLLLDRGADTEAADRMGWTPLYTAAREYFGPAPSLIKLLKTRGARYSIEPAAAFGDAKRVRELLKENLDAFRQLPQERQTWLFHWVVGATWLKVHRQVPIVKLLLEHGADPNAVCAGFGGPPLTRADNAEIAELLLQHGANVNLPDDNGRTALQGARGNAALQDVLRRYGGKTRLPKNPSRPDQGKSEGATVAKRNAARIENEPRIANAPRVYRSDD